MKLAVLCDLREERWPSMDTVAERLIEHAAELDGVQVLPIRPALPPPLARLTSSENSGLARTAAKASLAWGRYLAYPAKLYPTPNADWFHVADHSYAHLVFALPKGRAGVFCHDLDAFRPLFAESKKPGYLSALSRLLLAGLQRARVVFHSTPAVRDEILERRLLPAERLVHAPYGVSAVYQSERRPEDDRLAVARPFVLHVGSLIPRKNPEFLLRLVARLRRERPELGFVQVGGQWGERELGWLEREGLTQGVSRLSGVSDPELAALYRAAGAVLLPSRAEGFGLPIIEALACGAPVVVSDLPVLRQVAGSAASFCPLDDLEGWCSAVIGALDGRAPPVAERLTAASRFTWAAHAATVVSAYPRS